jgi:predicted small integral membrane protein
MRTIRYCKTVFVAVVALLFTLVSIGNITDYTANWQFVQHVLAMDTIFPDSDLRWRAITNPALQTAAYLLIIGWETLTTVVLWVGAARLLAAIQKPDFAEAKTTALLGLSLGFVLYGAGFVAAGGEWFAMWQSQTWNGQQKAFEFIGMIVGVLILLLIPEPESIRPPA